MLTIGTLGILEAASAKGLLPLSESIRRLKQTSIYLTEGLYTAALERGAKGMCEYPSSPHQFLHSSADFLDVGAGVEGGNAEIPLASRTKSRTRRDDHLRFG